MTRDDTAGDATPTRRDYLASGGAAVATALIAGCAGDGDTGSTPAESTPTESAPAETTATETGGDGTSHSVTMEPVGTVEFDRVPETIAPFTADYIDMLVALGHGDAARSIWYRGRYKTIH